MRRRNNADPGLWFILDAQAPVIPTELERVVNRALSQGMKPGRACLQGPGAIELVHHPGELRIGHLCACAASGRPIDLVPQSVALPVSCSAPQAVILGFALDYYADTEGSAVSAWSHRAFLLETAPSAAGEGCLVVGRLDPGRGSEPARFTEDPTWSDRFDASGPLAAWAARARDILSRHDEEWALLASRLESGACSPLLWTSLLTPVLVRLAEAEGALRNDAEPGAGLAALNRYIGALRELGGRAGRVGARLAQPFLSRFARDVAEASSLDDPYALATVCGSLERAMESVLSILTGLTRTVGAARPASANPLPSRSDLSAQRRGPSGRVPGGRRSSGAIALAPTLRRHAPASGAGSPLRAWSRHADCRHDPGR